MNAHSRDPAFRHHNPYSWDDDDEDAQLRRAVDRARPKRKRGQNAAIVTALKAAIDMRLKVSISYVDAYGEITDRIIQPLAFTDPEERKMLKAWCELRQQERHFRPSRIETISVLREAF